MMASSYRLLVFLVVVFCLLGQNAAGILKQVHPDGNVYPVQYFSRTLRPHEKNYSISELECLAIGESVEKFRIYLMGRKFTIVSDHHALQWLKTIKNPSGRLFRWSLRLSSYEYEVRYIKGKLQYEADLLSRNPFCGFLDATLIKTHQPPPSKESSLTIDHNGLHTVSRKGVTKIIIPKPLIQQFLQTVHTQYNHPGISQMSRLISTQYYWQGMSKDIKQKVKTCPTCQLTKRPLEPTYGELSQPPEAKEPFDLLSLDTIAGFAKYGNTKIYLHVVVDHFSRYAWTFPSKSTSIITYQQVLKRVLQDGSPKRLLTDRAPAFTSPKFRSFLLNRNIHPLLTTSNNPQANGLCERLNATLTGKLRLLHLENPKIAWTKLVKRVTIIYNKTPHSTTGFPPIYLMFGILPPELSDHSTPYPDIDKARKIAHTRTQNKHLQDKNIYDQRHKQPHFEVGDLVLVKLYHHPNTGKLAPYFTGPHTILEIISPNVVRIDRPNQPLQRDNDTIHVNKLKLYTETVRYISPPAVRICHIKHNPNYTFPFKHLTPELFPAESLRFKPTSSEPFRHLDPAIFATRRFAPLLPDVKNCKPDNHFNHITPLPKDIKQCEIERPTMNKTYSLESRRQNKNNLNRHFGNEEPEDEISLTTCGLVDPPFSENEVKLTAFKFGKRKSPGPEGIDNTVVKALPAMAAALQKFDMDPEQQLYTPKIVDIAADVMEMHAGILKQVHPDGNVYPVQYFSRTLRPHEKNYSISELECLAIGESVEKFRIYLMGRKFTIVSDHHALQWLKTIKNPSGRLFRWSLRLSSYEYEVRYIKGKLQYEADLLSRNPFCGFLDATLIKTHQPPPSKESSLTIDHNGLHTVSQKGVTKIIIPKPLIQQLLQTVHTQYNHPGISQMSRLISTQYYWQGMSKDIKQKVKTCPTCQLTKRPLGPTYGELSQPPEAKEPFDLLSLDTIAGFAKYGNTKIYLHVVVDHFSRYAWTFPSKSTSIITYQQVLKRVLQDGSPKRLLTDRAPAFTSPKFRSFLLNRNIHPLLTTSNNPQANGLCERLNATLTGKLRLLHLENPKIAWTKLVKRVTIIYNKTPHSTTGFPPIYLMFGILPPELSDHSTPYPDIDKARKIAHTRTQNKHLQDKNIYDQRHKQPHFEVGDLVLVKLYHHPNTGKLAPYFTGPHTILEIISPNVVRIDRPNQPLQRDNDTIHVNKLKLYTEKVRYISPPAVRICHIKHNPNYTFPFKHLTPELFPAESLRFKPTSSEPFRHLDPAIFATRRFAPLLPDVKNCKPDNHFNHITPPPKDIKQCEIERPTMNKVKIMGGPRSSVVNPPSGFASLIYHTAVILYWDVFLLYRI
ncbi:hypothetical protein LAZ67_22002340 [Cordylochernes scorpioides]|uniref:RNA-directed DNA polymerase n=1 Tax=Cordylochernes scorpioides TaxID=51811 RepID=A0ABY6LQI8_9ARAC|nr:hypothetical protein LAZ67_22002340 [Cordylochernes scorpioides]